MRQILVFWQHLCPGRLLLLLIFFSKPIQQSTSVPNSSHMLKCFTAFELCWLFITSEEAVHLLIILSEVSVADKKSWDKNLTEWGKPMLLRTSWSLKSFSGLRKAPKSQSSQTFYNTGFWSFSLHFLALTGSSAEGHYWKRLALIASLPAKLCRLQRFFWQASSTELFLVQMVCGLQTASSDNEGTDVELERSAWWLGHSPRGRLTAFSSLLWHCFLAHLTMDRRPRGQLIFMLSSQWREIGAFGWNCL